MRFYADLHVHSYYSRATSKEANIRGLYLWASRKGIKVVGSGDFTHPGWLKELEDGLEETEPGLYMPKDARDLDRELPESLRIRPRFMLSVEISSIYKKGDRVRKVHTVILMPDLRSARAFHAALDRLGNVRSDGRPILGLDPKEILKIAKSIHGDCEVIPAHIWTPWFSTLGAKSGFDSIQECFEEETQQIHALETGLSSDPTMNYLVSGLDRYTLVSHSDAHSPSKLGREADILNTSMSYHAIVQAIRDPSRGFEGTVEFYPEEGKYHFDGHRKCGVVLTPEEAVDNGGLCPVCGKPLTMGVMHRVLELADRKPGMRPRGKPLELHQIPLPEVIGELYGVGPTSKRVARAYERLLASSGPELPLLMDNPLNEIEEIVPTLSTAIRRIRAGEVNKEPGYDGVFGKISVFGPGELDELRDQGLLFGLQVLGRKPAKTSSHQRIKADKKPAIKPTRSTGLTAYQRDAVMCKQDCAVIAGPGTGKTFVLTRRIGYLLEQGIPPEGILAVTFTTAAAMEIKHRLKKLAGEVAHSVRVMTLHAFGRKIAAQLWPEARLLMPEEQREILKKRLRLNIREAGECLDRIALYKSGAGEKPRCFKPYQQELEALNALDMDDLIWRVGQAIEDDLNLLKNQGIIHALVDEVQDVSPSQAKMLVRIKDAGATLFVIGDPEQSIYGFRGSMPNAVDFLMERCPNMRRISLSNTFRLTRELADFAAPTRTDGLAFMTGGHGPKPRFFAFKTPKQEAIFVAKEIAGLVGGLDMQGSGSEGIAFGDIAVLGRTRRVLDTVKEALETEGIPVVTGNDTGVDPVMVARTFMGVWLGRSNSHDLRSFLEARGVEVSQAMERAIAFIESMPAEQDGAVNRLWELLNAALKGMGRLPDIADLIDSPDPQALSDMLNLMTRVAALNLKGEGVRLLTLHASKGLQFKAVFLIGVQDGLLPFAKARTQLELAEERRLFHVGVTRSSSLLYLTSVAKRNLTGLDVKKGKSMFMDLIPAETFEDTTVKLPRKKKKTYEQPELF